MNLTGFELEGGIKLETTHVKFHQILYTSGKFFFPVTLNWDSTRDDDDDVWCMSYALWEQFVPESFKVAKGEIATRIITDSHHVKPNTGAECVSRISEIQQEVRSLSLCCLTTPGLSKNIRCRV